MNEEQLTNDAGIMDILAVSTGWVLMIALYGKIETIASGGLTLAKNYIALGEQAIADGIHLTYAGLDAGIVGKMNTAWKGWTPKQRQGYALLEVTLERRLQDIQHRFLTERTGGFNGRKTARAVIQELVGGKKALQDICKAIRKKVDGFDQATTFVMECPTGDWKALAAIAAMGAKMTKAKKFSKTDQLQLVVIEHDDFDDIDALCTAAIDGFGSEIIGTWASGSFVTDEQVTARRQASADRLKALLD